MKNIKKNQKENKTDDRLYHGRKKDGVIFPVAPTANAIPVNYQSFLSSLK